VQSDISCLLTRLMVIVVEIEIPEIHSRIRTVYFVLGEHEMNNKIKSNKEFHQMKALNKSETINQTINNWQLLTSTK
jgi:hypothetical protein